MEVGNELTVLNVVMATPDARGGAVRAGLSLGEALRNHATVDVAKMAGDEDEALFSELGLDGPVVRLPTVTAVADATSVVSDHTNAFMWPRLTLPRELEEYDVVHLHNAMPLWGMVRVAAACAYRDVPYCVTLHGVSKLPNWPDELGLSRIGRAAFAWAVERPYAWVLENATHLFALSERDRRFARDRFDADSVSVVANGVLVPDRTDSGDAGHESDERTGALTETGIEPGDPLVLFVGDKRPSKGLGDLLTAFDALDVEATLVVVGPDEDPGLQRRLAEAGETVRDRGYVDRTELKALYAAADVFAFPTRSDVLPLVVLEALAHGTPVVSTRVGAIPEVVDADVGRLVDTEAPDQVADAVAELLADDEKRAQMGRLGRERVAADYSWDAIAAETVATYRNSIPGAD